MAAFIISAAESGVNVAEALHRRLGLSRRTAEDLVLQRRVYLNGKPCLSAEWRVKRRQRLEVRDREPERGQAGAAAAAIRYLDPHVVVVDKPTGLTTMRHPDEAAEFGKRATRFLPATLADLLPSLLASAEPGKHRPLRAVHRLDKDTSGLVVFARSLPAESNLGKQFRAHSIERRYLALVRGRAKPGRIESFLVRDRGDGRRGSTNETGQGQRAVTNVRVLEELGDYTLVECRLETGRTHQVRIHLGERGTPICGERVYDRPLHGKPVPDSSGAPRLALHAATLGFDHPETGKRMTWHAPLPRDLKDLLGRLRRQAARGEKG
jgi:23S rRNA pseudouridine1911/1915/1917 synthase